MTPRKANPTPMKGNKFGVKLKNPDIRQQAYAEYCEHVASGLSTDSFYFEHEQLTCTYKTLLSYIEKYPDEFPAIHMEVAKMKGYQGWEKVVADSAKGQNVKANTASLQMIMRNKFGWDKEKKDVNKQNLAALIKGIKDGEIVQKESESS